MERAIRAAVPVCAVWFAAVGVFLLFAPVEAARLLVASDGGGPLVQLLGAACLASAVATWTVRRAPLGGIYGKAVVAGNQMHLTVGALVLLDHGLEAGGPPAFWILTACYVLAAVLFLTLAFGGGTKPIT
jgi:hypothetical protein